MIPLSGLRRAQTKQTARPLTIIAPVGGLNGRDPLAEMDAKDAFVMDNWFPSTNFVESRNGSDPWATGVGAAVESLIPFTSGAASKMLAFGNGKIFNVSAAGAVGAAIKTGKTSNRIIDTMFSNAAGTQFLMGVSGADNPFSYDGTTLNDALAITGLTGSINTLSYVFAFKQRLYFAQKDQPGFYYLPVGQIAGAASYFDLGQFSRRGGYLNAIASFSLDGSGGSEPEDYIVFIMSTGEHLVYSGFDPSNAANWSLVGRYYSAPPIGRRCTFTYGSELVVITTEGAFPFSAIRKEGGIDPSDAITSKLGRLLLDKNVNSGVFGWQALTYAKGGMLIVNVPAGASIADEYVQFVQNTSTKAWTRFTGWNGICWCEFLGNLYFGQNDGRVMLADTETRLDDGDPIKLDCKQAYNYFEDGTGTSHWDKLFHFAKMSFGCDATPPVSAQLNVDYENDQPEYVAAPPDGGGSPWDTSSWDTSSWGSDIETKYFTVSLGKYGTAGSLWLRAVLQGTKLQWYSTKYTFSRAQVGLP